jgi:predicted AAA+ superfamily ATPase
MVESPTPVRPRLIESTLLDRLRRSPVVVVVGARQTGKTTLVRTFPLARGRRYETLDALATLDRARHEPEALVASEEPLTLDEVQRAPELLIAIKREVDRNRRPGRFLLTGSTNLLLQKGVGDSLAGRAFYLTLRPLTEREKSGRPAPVWPKLFEAEDAGHAMRSLARKTAFDWRQAALAGGFPPAALISDEVGRQLWFDGYVETYVQRDLRDLAQVGDLGAFARLMKLAAMRNGGLLNHADLARDAALGRTTAQRWLSLLETSYLVTSVPAFAASRGKRLIKAPKLYFGDTGLGLHLAGVADSAMLADEPNQGVWLENVVLNDVLAWRESETRKPEIHHFRSAGGQEIDFVIQQGRRLLPIEIKSKRAARADDARSIDEFCRSMGPARSPFGVLLYDGTETTQLTRYTLAAPLGAIL